MVKGHLTKYVEVLNIWLKWNVPTGKRTKKYLSLRDRLLSIKANILKIESFTESTHEMLCVYGKGSWESNRKRFFFKWKFHLSKYMQKRARARAHTQNLLYLISQTSNDIAQKDISQLPPTSPTQFPVSGNRSTISHELTESCISFITAHKTLWMNYISL